MSIENEQVTADQAANGVLAVQKITATPAASLGTGTVVQAPVAQPVVSPVPVVAAPVLTPEPTPVKPAAPVLPEIKAIFEKAKAEATATGKMMLDQIEAYMEAMAPKKPQDIKSINRWQVQLYKSLQTIVNKCEDDFFLVWRTVLAVFHAQKDGVFHESCVFRGMQHVSLPADDQKGFQRILNLIKATAEPRARQAAIKQIDFKKTLEFGVTEAGRSKLLNFYNA